MIPYRCFACGEDIELEKVKGLNLIEIKPCKACLAVAEEEAFEKGREAGLEDGHSEGYEEAKDKIEKGEKL